jgi:PAS domain S-box-containing protein
MDAAALPLTLDKLIQDLHVGVLIQGPRAEILLSNQAALDLLGLTEDQLLGKTSFDPDWNVVHEDGSPFPSDTRPVAQAIATRRPVRDVVMGVYRPKVGDRVWLLVSAVPQLVDGAVRHVVCTFSDITAQRQREIDNASLFRAAERRLAELSTVQRVAQAINSAMSLGAIFQTVVTQIGQAFGYQLVSIYLREGDGLRLQAYQGYDDVVWFIRLDQGISGRVARTSQPMFVRAIEDEPDFIVVYPGTRQAIIVPLKHSDGQVLGTLAVESDGTPELTDDDFVLLNLLADQISVAIVNARLYAEIQDELAERKRLEDERLALERQLLEAQKMESLGVLAGGIAHDFNNLLQIILGNAGLARTDVSDQARVVKSLSRIEEASQRAAELTQQLLAYAGKGRYIVQQVDLDAVLAATLQQMRASIGETIALQHVSAAAVPPILADEAQLRQIARNLILNAAEAIGDAPGTITVTTGVQRLERSDLLATLFSPDLPPDDYVYLEVADDGSGVDPAYQTRIFEPFFSTRFTGRGLGLPAVLGSVRSHQGALRLWSNPGEGSRIRVWLPALREEHLVPSTATLPATSGRRQRPAGATLLVIDDEDGVRSVTARLLERAGYAVLTAADGRAGVATFRSRSSEIDCVLLDLTMPRFGGEQTLRELQLIRSDVPILLMSGYSEEDATSRFAGRRLAGFLHKPFTPAELCAKVERLLQP